MGRVKIHKTNEEIRAAALGKKRLVFKEIVILGLVSWSWKTLKAKIDNDGFPAIYENGFYYFERESIEAWWKKRKLNNAA